MSNQNQKVNRFKVAMRAWDGEIFFMVVRAKDEKAALQRIARQARKAKFEFIKFVPEETFFGV